MAIVNVLSDQINVVYTGNGKQVVGKIGAYTGNFDAGVATVILAGAVNKLITINFPVTTIQAFIMESSQNLTVLTNSSGSPANTLTLKGTSALYWGNDLHYANPLTVAVTALYISNPGSVDSTFNLRVLYN